MRMRVLPALTPASAAPPPAPAPPPPTPAAVRVYLNIYDISPINNYLYWFGLGIFHSGLEEDLAEDYHGDTYHLIVNNCNHFTADVCKRLTGKPTPGWVNRLAKFGSVCNCVLPENIKVSAVRDETADLEFSDDDGLESNASIVDDSDLDDLDHLLTTPNSDIVSSKDKTLTPGRDSL